MYEYTIKSACSYTYIYFYQLKVMEVPAGKLRDKGTPIENLSRFDGTKEEIVYLTSAQAMKGQILVFATKMAMVKQVPAQEFETNNRLVAATKLQEEDKLLSVTPVQRETEVVLQTTGGVFLRFALQEISLLKKNSRGVRGIKLAVERSWRLSICWEKIQLPSIKEK